MDLNVSTEWKWPQGNVHLTPTYFEITQQRLRPLRWRFRHFLQTQDPEVGFKLDWLLVRISEVAFSTIQVIAQQVPPTVPVDPCFESTTSALASQLQAVTSDSEKPDFISQIEALPNPDWDAVFQGYCRVLEASVDAYLIGDSPMYKVKLADAVALDMIFRILRGLISDLESYPFLRSYYNRLMRKLEGSRSDAVYTDWWMKNIPPNTDPTPKRKIDTLDLDGPAKKRLLKEMKNWPKLDRLLSSPPSY
ncbi:hypothetical protein F4859DRAFT_516422 [Xylaria cf. heliscus]|nr:hypothetical protein F4859DRAFT_516422 [Xylaria cf. heliscus]